MVQRIKISYSNLSYDLHTYELHFTNFFFVTPSVSGVY